MSMLIISGSSTSKKLTEFLSLPAGWHYGQGGPISDAQVEKGSKILSFITIIGFTRTDAFPGADGAVMITGYHAGHYLSTTVEANGTYSIVHEFEGSECCSDEFGSNLEAKKMLLKIAEEIWPTSAWSIPGTSTKLRGSSTTWHSSALLTTAGCHLSSEAASTIQAA